MSYLFAIIYMIRARQMHIVVDVYRMYRMYSNLLSLICRYCRFKFIKLPFLFGFKQDNSTAINVNKNMITPTFMPIMLFVYLH